MQFLNKNKIRKVANAATAATTAVESSAVDMANFEQVTFMASIAVANAGNHMTVQQSDTSVFTVAETLDGAKAVALENGDVVAVNVFRPLKRYVRAVLTRTASTATGEIYAAQTGGRTIAVDNNEASEIVSAIVSSPAVAA